MPALGVFLHLYLYQQLKRRVPLLMERMLDVMGRPSLMQPFCEFPLATLPQMTHMHSAFLVHRNFRKTDFGPSTEGLDTSVSLYTFYPLDTNAPSYDAAVEEVNRLQQESFLGIRATMTAGVWGGGQPGKGGVVSDICIGLHVDSNKEFGRFHRGLPPCPVYSVRIYGQGLVIMDPPRESMSNEFHVASPNTFYLEHYSR